MSVTVSRAWLFDVDGVLTHPVEKRVVEEKLFDLIVGMLERREPVSLNTGRSIDFMIKQVLDQLEARVGNKSLLQNVLAIGEKGSVWVGYDKVGNRFEQVDESVTVPSVIQEEVKQVVKGMFDKAMFYDETKRTMVSVEMRDGYNWQDFKKYQVNLDKQLLRILESRGLEESLKIDPSRIATDVEHKHVGKALGARRFLNWLSDRQVTVEKFIAFGDSKSDIGMAQEIHSQHLPVEFIFVGEEDLLKNSTISFPVIYTTQKCEKGTLEYLLKIII